MGLFDDIINEQQTSSTAVANPPAQGGSGSWQKDDSILIIDDVVTETVTDSLSTATSFINLDTGTAAEKPQSDSAADLIVFDDAPVAVASTTSLNPELVVLEETPAVTMTNIFEEKDQTTELSNLLAQANEENKQAPSFFAEETIATPVIAAVAQEAVAVSEENAFIAFAQSPVVEEAKDIKPLEDPNAILDASIVQLESLNMNHDLVRQAREKEIDNKNQAISELNKQISLYKKEITGLNKEIDKIDTEKARVAEMIKLFQSQKAA